MKTDKKIFLLKANEDERISCITLIDKDGKYRLIKEDFKELTPEELDLLKNWLTDSIDNMELAGCGENEEEQNQYKLQKTLLKKLEEIL